MKFKKTIINNFGPFYGKQEAEFSTSSEKNVTLFHALNNVGKTSLLRAVVWCLYGEVIPDDAGNLPSIINNDALSESKMDCFVEIEFEHEGIDFIFRRDLENVKIAYGTPLCNLIKKDGSVISQVPELIIDKIIPKKLASFFFIKGENSVFFREDSDLTESIEGILGITILDNAIKDVKYAYSRFNSQLKKCADDAVLAEIAQKIEDKENVIEITRIDIEKEERNFKEHEQMLKDVLNAIGDIKLEEGKAGNADEMEKKIKTLEKSIDIQKGKQADWFRNHITALLTEPIEETVGDFLNEKRLEKKLPYDYAKEFIQGILKKGECVCGRILDTGSDQEAKLRELEEDAPDRYVNDYLWAGNSYLGKVKENRKSLLKDFYAIEDELFKLEQSLEAALLKKKGFDEILKGSGAGAEKLLSKRDSLQATLIKIGKNKEILNSQLTEHLVASKDLESKKSVAREQNQEAGTCVRLGEIARRLQRLAQDDVDERRSNSKIEIEEEVNKILSESLRQTGIRAKINDKFQVDPESYVGGGVNRIVKFAYTAALLNYNRNRRDSFQNSAYIVPMFIDSAFGVNDGEYKKVLAGFLPRLSEQLICLVSDSQGSSFSEELSSSIGEEYVMMRDEKGKNSNNLKGGLNIRGSEVITYEYNSERSLTKFMKIGDALKARGK